MRIILISILLLTSLKVLGQVSDITQPIEINTRFVLELFTKDSINYTYKIIKKEPFSKILDLSERESLLDKEVNNNNIQGIFTYGNFGNSKSIMLVIRSGIKNPLNYDLNIKVNGDILPIKTSVMPLYKNVSSTEIWPEKVDYIVFSNFRVIEKTEYTLPQVTVDSSCIKNSQRKIEWADDLLLEYLNTLNIHFQSASGLKLKRMVDFETGIKSIDITPDHFIDIGTGIYPNRKKYKLDNCLSYKRVECPFFETEVDYYYAKSDNQIRVVLFEWNVFKENNLFGKGMPIQERTKIFNDKFNKIEIILTKLLGSPTKRKIPRNKGTDTFRNDIKWKSKNGVKAYLFMFGNDENNYRQIRLAIYKD